ncbi:hypothetical protein CL629_04320 [bacterium]|nr:hypothetical protein [bacterium]|tara:strand:- start:8915 stop:10132 length:1218 start_codon:yes stop_codon:yes gene_type:complete
MIEISGKKILLIIGIIAIIVFALAIVWNDLNFSFFVNLLFVDAKEFAEEGSITADFMPIGYSSFLGSCMKIGGAGGIPACQSLVYAGVLLMAFWFLRPREGGFSILRALGIAAVALHPMLILNIWRVHDGNLTTLLLMGLLASGIAFIRFKSMRWIILLGVFSGLLFTVRPNTISLVVITLLLLLAAKGAGTKIKRLGRIVIFAAIAVFLVMGVNTVVKQAPSFFARHGMYNLFAGTNEYAEQYLLSDYSGENSLEEALKARGFIEETFEERLAFPSETYRELALDYVRAHPFEYAKLTAIKFITILRPGYHVPDNFAWGSMDGVKRIVKIALALPILIWIFIVWKTRKSFFDEENIFIFLIVIFYLLPFLLANADPRMRFPLDILLVADIFRRLAESRRAQART